MACPCSAKFSCDFRVYNSHGCRVGHRHMIGSGRLHLVGINESLKRDSVTLHQLCAMWIPIKHVPSRCDVMVCRSVLIPGGGSGISLLDSATVALTRLCDALQQSPIVLQLIPAVSIITFSAWGLGPLLRLGRILFLQRTDSSWNESRSHYVMTSYLQPLLLWTGAILICRALDPVILPSEASQAVKQRLLNFVRSLSTVLAFALCLSSLIQQVQKFFKETNDSSDPRNMGFDFAGKAMYTVVWVAAVSSFMELLGFSAQKWLTAGGLSTVLLTLAGREIFTNFLSSIMIHATRPFAVDEWIQTKIQGYEVSGTVEHVGWWSPTIVRGDDREAVHIPNHKFTVNVVRNLSQKSHWRIKTHIAINHLDVNKINIIVADMRKVLAKSPQVEQQKLHRRVFLENINPENQALLILISCFVKTSRFEEYLYVKEGILLDLLRVVSHHGARLATPIRTVQKMYSETELENEQSEETTRPSGATHRPLLLAESAYKINGEERVNTSTHPKEKNVEKDLKIDESSIPDSKSERKTGPVRVPDLPNDDSAAGTTASTPSSVTKLKSGSGTQAQKMSYDDSISKSSKLVEPNDDSGDIGEETFGAASTELPQNVPVPGQGENLPSIQQAKEDDKSVLASSSPRPSFEDNLVLGVALEGSKRTLPIDEEVNPTPFPTESKGFANQERDVSRFPSGKDKKDGHAPNPPMKKND